MHSLRPHSTFACLKGPMFRQTPINGSECCVMRVILPVRIRGSLHSCCLSTVSTCLAIPEHYLGLFLEEYRTIVFLRCLTHTICNTHNSQWKLWETRQCHLPWKLWNSGHRVIWNFMLHLESGITPWSLSVDLKLTLIQYVRFFSILNCQIS